MSLSNKRKLIFVHIPKNAGTSIIKDLDMYDEGHHKWKYYQKKYPKKWKNYKKFCVIRNPYSRLISCFEYAKMKKSYYHSVKGKSIYGKHPDYELLKNISFEDCVNMLYKKPNKFKHHGWERQINYIADKNDNIVMDEIIHMENLNNELKEKMGLEIDNNLNKSNDKNIEDYYNKSLMLKVEEMYKKDFNLLGYDMQSFE